MTRANITGGLLSIVLLLCVCALPADVLYFNQGEELTGRLLGVSGDTLTFQEIGKAPVTWPTATVAHVLVSTLREGDEIDEVAKLTDGELKNLIAQAPGLERFPNSDSLTLRRERRFTFAADGSVVYRRRVLKKVLKEPGQGEANLSIYYFRDREEVKIVHAHTYAPDGRIHHLTDDALADEAIFESTPEYDKLRRIKFAMKKVDLGAVIDVCHEIKTKYYGPLLPFLIDFTFREREPVLVERLEIVAPKSLALHREFRRGGLPYAPKFTQRDDGDRVVLTWEATNLPETVPEQNMPAYDRIFPRVLVSAQRDWASVGQAWAEAERKARQGSEAAIEAALRAALSESVATGAETRIARSEKQTARVLYEWVLKNVRLDGGSPADCTFEPVPVTTTLQKRYGNNQARLVVLQALLAKAGIGARFGFTRPWSEEDVASAVPELGQYSEAILEICCDGVTKYCMCVNDHISFGILSSGYQGGAAIFIDAAGKPEFTMLPETTDDDNLLDRLVNVEVGDDGSMKVRDVRQFAGPYESGLRPLRASKEKELKIWAQRQVRAVHPKAELLDFAIVDPTDLAAPLLLTLEYRIPDAALRASDQLMAFRNYWVGYSASSISLASRTYPMQYGITERNSNTVIFRMPSGFRWVPWGQKFQYDSGDVRYTSAMKENGSLLVFTDRFQSWRKYYPDAVSYDRYRGCITTMSDLSKQWIVLERAAGSPGTTVAPMPTVPPATVPASEPVRHEAAPDPQG